MSKDTNAGGVVAGFIYQTHYFLYLLLTMQKGDTVSLEKFEDAGVEGDGVRVYYQLKHTVATAGISGETIQLDTLADMICQNEEQRKGFEDYRQFFEKEHGRFEVEVNVVKKASPRKLVSKLTTLKHGVNFEVKVLSPESRIKHGKDEMGTWWKLYS